MTKKIRIFLVWRELIFLILNGEHIISPSIAANTRLGVRTRTPFRQHHHSRQGAVGRGKNEHAQKDGDFWWAKKIVGLAKCHSTKK